MKTRLLLAGVAVLVALPFAASAAGFDYTYVEGGYVTSRTDVGPRNVDGDGLGIRGSAGLNDQINLIADYTTQDFGSGVDTSSFDVGAGAHWGVKNDLDFVGELTWVQAKVETPFGSATDDGFGLGAGLRYRPADKVELQGMVNYVDLASSDTSLGLAGRYYLSKAFSLGAGLVLDNGDATWNIGVRAGFGGR